MRPAPRQCAGRAAALRCTRAPPPAPHAFCSTSLDLSSCAGRDPQALQARQRAADDVLDELLVRRVLGLAGRQALGCYCDQAARMRRGSEAALRFAAAAQRCAHDMHAACPPLCSRGAAADALLPRPWPALLLLLQVWALLLAHPLPVQQRGHRPAGILPAAPRGECAAPCLVG